MAIFFRIERSDVKFQARADGAPPFFVGFQTRFDPDRTGTPSLGLFNVPTNLLPALLYTADGHRQTNAFWADFIEPTAVCEGQNFLTLNTYDRARFTWGFGQFAAHVPDGDFVLFLRDLLQRPESLDYFPDLEVRDGRIVNVRSVGVVPLETRDSTEALMAYLNPTLSAVEDDEVVAGAKLIHWTTNHLEAQALQVTHMVRLFKQRMIHADRRLGLDGKPATLCSVICDILHQGRATFATMQQLLLKPDPMAGLLAIGRGAKLAKAIKARPEFDGKAWARTTQAFA